jgi:hypothetical protein
MELTVLQLAIIGLVASLVTQVFKVIFAKAGWKPSGIAQMFILVAVSSLLAAGFVFQSGGWPALEGEAIFAFASAIIGVAAVVYNLLLKKVVFPALLK